MANSSAKTKRNLLRLLGFLTNLVAGTRNTRFLRLVEQAIPLLAA
jgi:hypothetical protein